MTSNSEITLPSRAPTEKLLYAQLKSWLKNEGHLIRLENLLIPGLPDCLFVYKGQTVFMELKICRSNKISMPIFQHSHAIMLANHLAPWLHWYFIQDEDFLLLYKFSTIRLAKGVADAHERYIVNLSNIDPDFIITRKEDMRDWLEFLRMNNDK